MIWLQMVWADGMGFRPSLISWLVIVLIPVMLGFTTVSSTADSVPRTGGHCVDLRKSQGIEYLVNSCGRCQIVEVERNRPGMVKPTQHSYTLPTGSPLQLSFLGPGDTRVRKERSCDKTASQPNIADDGKTCVSLQKNASKGMVLLNSCSVCRLAIVERLGLRDGDPNGHRPYALTARSIIPIKSQGATGARIVRDGPCPN